MKAMEDMEPMDHWMTMFHGYTFLTVNRQDGPSGERDFESQNHFMFEAMRAWAGGKLLLLGTLSLEPATIPAAGSPELFQRGETYRGLLLIDRQHAHDFFVQLGAAWEKKLSQDFRLRLYAAPVGEPALGPTPYVHRLSASENPAAPLSHHNQDSTHVSYDVVTLGASTSIATLEGSVFHGAEPDENRWNIEAGPLDSYSGRLTLRPLPYWTLQLSGGHLEHPESTEEGNQTRATASLSYQKATPRGFLAVSLISGRNTTAEGVEWGTLLEWTWKFAGMNFLYGRLESADRDLYELTFKRQRPEGVSRQRTRVQAGTLGFVREAQWLPGIASGLGADVTLYGFSRRLDGAYGKHPVSFHVFVRFRFGSHWVGMDHDHSSHGAMSATTRGLSP
jgi:hypothetical protein